MWFSAIKLAVSAGSKIYANRQKAKVAMSDAQLLHAERQARGEEAYQGKLLEARQNDYKDEFVLVILSAPIVVLAWGVFSDDPGALEKVKTFCTETVYMRCIFPCLTLCQVDKASAAFCLLRRWHWFVCVVVVVVRDVVCICGGCCWWCSSR